MIEIIDRRATGVNIRRLMDKHDISVKDLQCKLHLGSVQSIYHWLNGITLPSLDNLYAMSSLFGVAMDDMICGSRPLNQARRPVTFFVESLTSKGVDYIFVI